MSPAPLPEKTINPSDEATMAAVPPLGPLVVLTIVRFKTFHTRRTFSPVPANISEPSAENERLKIRKVDLTCESRMDLPVSLFHTRTPPFPFPEASTLHPGDIP